MALYRFGRLGVLMGASLLTIAFSANAAADAGKIDIQHAAGTTELASPPSRTVVYDLAVLDTLDVLGIQATGVPQSIWPPYLSQYEDDKKFPKVGTLFEPDYEAVNALRPDLIIVAGRSAPKYRELSRLAPTIDLTVDNGDLVNSVKHNAWTLATLFDRQAQAQKEISALDAALADINQQSAGVDNALVILTVGGKISAYGPGSRFGILHDAFGLKPAVVDLENTTHGQAVSLEFIYQTDPQWLFVIDRDAAIGTDSEAAQRLLDNELIHKTQAWKNNRVVYLNPLNWYLLGSASLNALQQSIAEVSEAIGQSMSGT